MPRALRLGDRPRRNVSRLVVGPLNEAERRLSSSSDIEGLASKAQSSNREALRFARSLSLFDQGRDRLVIPKMRERKSTAVSFKRGLNLFLLKEEEEYQKVKEGARTAATQQSSAIQPVSYSIGMIATPKAGGGHQNMPFLPVMLLAMSIVRLISPLNM